MLNDPNISVRKFVAFVADMAASAAALIATCLCFFTIDNALGKPSGPSFC